MIKCNQASKCQPRLFFFLSYAPSAEDYKNAKQLISYFIYLCIHQFHNRSYATNQILFLFKRKIWVISYASIAEDY